MTTHWTSRRQTLRRNVVPATPTIISRPTTSFYLSHHTVCGVITALKPDSARTGRTVFSQLLAAVVRHKANDGVVNAIRAWFKYNTALSAVV